MKIVKNILKWTLILVVGFLVFLFGSIAVDGLTGGGRIAKVTNTTTPGITGGPDVRASVAKQLHGDDVQHGDDRADPRGKLYGGDGGVRK